MSLQNRWLKRVAGLPNQMNNKNPHSFFTGIIVSVLLLVLFAQTTFANSTESDFDSIIIQPIDQVTHSKKLDRIMYRNGILNFRKINNDTYIIPLNGLEDRNAKIAELKHSGLFKLVEPDYKLSLDQDVPERDYTKIIKHSPKGPTYPKPADTTSADVVEITPNDRGFNSQYYLREINATKAWNTTVGNSLLVGILDTGVDANHPDLDGKISTSANPDYLTDQIGHGTEVAGIIAARTNNNQGIAGIAWNTKLLPLRITDENGVARVSTVVSALDEAYAMGVKIIQISLSTNQFSQTLKTAIEEANKRGILIVSTSGNTGIEELRFPAAFDNVIGVGAVNQSKIKESYSTTGEHVSLVAPGASIYTTSLDSGYAAVTGTSFAAPQIAGAAALVWSIAPELTNEEVRQVLFDSAEDLGDKGKDKLYGYGLLNTQKAVELAKAKATQAEKQTTEIPNIESWIKK